MIEAILLGLFAIIAIIAIAAWRSKTPLERIDDAHVLAREGRHAEAVAAYDRVLDVFDEEERNNSSHYMTMMGNWGHKKRALALAMRGVSLAALGRLDEALDSVDRAMEFGSGDARVRHMRATVLLTAGLHDEALDFIDESIALDPSDFEMHAVRAATLAENDDLDGALASMDRAIELAPRDKGLREAREGILAELDSRKDGREPRAVKF